MVFFKRLVSGMLYPLPLSLLMISLGLVLLWFSKKQAAGRVFATAGFLLLLICSYWPAAAALIAPLEAEYSGAVVVDSPRAEGSVPKRILVLNGGVITDATHPAASQLGDATLARMAEGVRLAKALPQSSLIVTATDPAVGAAMRQVALDLGVPASRITLIPTGGDTAAEAAALMPTLAGEPFYLVTSAAHMGRALTTFRARGLAPVPAPADFHALRRDSFTLDFIIPTHRALDISTRAIHEYYGALWHLLGGN